MASDKKTNILEFPLKKMIRQKTFQKNQERRVVFGLSILSLFIFTLAVNQWVRDYSLAQANSRGIASIKAEITEDILNEHAFAKKLADKDNGFNLIKALEPSLKDELMFSFLEGKYRIQTENSRIREINSNPEMLNSLIVIKAGDKLLRKYVSLFNEKAVHFKLKEQHNNNADIVEVYELLDSNGLVVDTVSVSIDANGKLAALKIL